MIVASVGWLLSLRFHFAAAMFVAVGSMAFDCPVAIAQNVAEMNPDQSAAAIIEATNVFRLANQLSKLTPSKQLNETARTFAQFMSKTDKYGHQADGRTVGERAKAAGYSHCIVLENIGWQSRSTGYTSADLAAKLTNAWKESPSHRKQMLDVDITETGVAVAEGPKPGKYYGVQLFGRPSSAQIKFKITNRTSAPITYRLINVSGEKESKLDPRYGRTHKLCRAAKIALTHEDRPRQIKHGQWLILIENDGKTELKIEPLDTE